MKILVMLLTFFIFFGCVYGPNTERKAPLNALNGENYLTAPDMRSDSLIVPFAKKKERRTTVKGQLVLHGNQDAQNGPSFPVPLGFVPLVFSNLKGEVMQKLTTQANGEFSLSGVFPNGNYKLKVESEQYSGELSFEINAYLVEKLILQAHKKEKPSTSQQ